MKTLPLLLLIPAFFIASSCDKFQKDPVVKLASSQATADGISITATVPEGKKQAKEIGFCFDKTSTPVAYSGYGMGTVTAEFQDKSFTSVIPYTRFESYEGYYIRPFVKTTKGEIFYGQEVYHENVHKPLITPSCNLTDNYCYIGANAPYTLSGVHVYYGGLDEYELDAYCYSNTNHLRFYFDRKPKTGVYTTNSYTSDDNTKIKVIINSQLLESGYPIYVNEVAKDKFEISLCEVPWKLSGNTTLYLSSKVIVTE